MLVLWWVCAVSIDCSLTVNLNNYLLYHILVRGQYYAKGQKHWVVAPCYQAPAMGQQLYTAKFEPLDYLI